MNFKIVAVTVEEEVKFCSRLLENNWKRCKKNVLLKKRPCDYAFFYVAQKEEVAIAFLYAHMVSISAELTYHSTAILEFLIVDVSCRNLGIGTLLLEVFLEFCYNHNIKIIETREFYENPFIRKLYWKLNIRKYSYRMNFDFDEEKV